MEHPNPDALPLIQRRKKMYPVSASLGQYLHHFGRLSQIPLVYDDLTHFEASIPYENPRGQETLWLTVVYNPETMAELRPNTEVISSAPLSSSSRRPRQASASWGSISIIPGRP